MGRGDGQRPVGFITAVDRYIDLLFVAPEYGRRGIASALLQELFTQIPHGSLTVDASITAKPCFERHGFRVVEEQQVAVRGETFINYRMEKVRRPDKAPRAAIRTVYCRNLLRRNRFQQFRQQRPVLTNAFDMHLLIRRVRAGNGRPD